jgi:ribosomal protein S18 acetylase RimI-like enzyme
VPRRSTTSPEEAAALQAAGARLERHAHDMVLDLPGDCPGHPSLPDGLSLGTGVEASPRLTRALLAAYPAGHPDVPPSGRTRGQADQEIADLLAGTAGGPVIQDASAVVTDSAGAVVAAVIVTRVEPEAWGWPGGPWVATVLVVPRWQGRGVGRAVMCQAITRCTAAGEARIGLTVTDGNPAQRLYAALGFRRRRTLYVFDA